MKHKHTQIITVVNDNFFEPDILKHINFEVVPMESSVSILFHLIIWGNMILYTFRQYFQFTLLKKLHQLIFSETAW